MSLTSHLSPGFFRDLAGHVARLQAAGAKVDGEDFLAVWLSESGLNPAQPNRAGHAFYGLNQLGDFHFPNVGFRGDAGDYLALSAEDQLPYVMRYYDNAVRGQGGPSVLRDRGSLYLANFTPANMSHAGDPSWVISSRGQKIYDANVAIDRARKGWIQVSDMADFVDAAVAQSPALWNEVVSRYRTEGGGSSPVFPQGGDKWRKVAGFAVLLASAGMLVQAVSPRTIPSLLRRIA